MRSLFLVVLALLLGFGAFTGYSFYRYHQAGASPERTLLIQPHTGARAIVSRLHAEGMVPAVPLVLVPLLLSGEASQLKAGEYQFEANLTPAQIVGKIARGEILIHKVTVPEGYTIYQVKALLDAEPLLTGALPEAIPEGSVFPNTEYFTRGETRQAVLTRLQKARDKVLNEEWAARQENLPLISPAQALVLASIVEQETGLDAERPLVAGVFINRLRLGMLLQSDPTVAYGIMVQRGGAPLGRALTLLDLKKDTLYNTYTRPGLPPLPICNPGRKALHAVLHPETTEALYFVASGEGGHHFAKSLEEHTGNVTQYHAKLRGQGHKGKKKGK